MSKVKSNILKKIFFFPLYFILLVIVLIILWFTFCFFDRTSSLNPLPPDYAVYLRTDSLWDTVEPVLDLDAVFTAMSSPDLIQYRNTYLKVKSSPLRKNFFVKLLLKRKVNMAVYKTTGHGMIAVLDGGILSGATRLLPVILPFTKITDTFAYIKQKGFSYFGNDDYGYFFFYKNLTVYASNISLLEQAFSMNHLKDYTQEDLKIVTENLHEPIRIAADGQQLLNLLSDSFDNYYFTTIANSLSEDRLSFIDFGISKESISLMAKFPFAVTPELENHPVTKLITKESAVPELLPQFSNKVQYYTLLSAGNLEEIKNASMKVIPADKNFQKYWDNGEKAAKMLFHKSLEEIVFSWTGEEFAILGMEEKAEPVIAIQIKDEAKRKEIFDTVFSSFIIKSSDNLLIDDVRLSLIETPSFINAILNALNINLPKPYFLVKDNFVYFSQSPENLVSIQNQQKSEKLSENQNWKKVSGKQSLYSSLSLFYNLERSRPFFIKGNSTISQILKLYNIGRCDISSKNNQIILELQAAKIKTDSDKSIPGFPIEISDSVDHQLYTSKNNKSIFWLEKDGILKKLDCLSLHLSSIQLKDVCYLCNTSDLTYNHTGGIFWGITKKGDVYLINETLGLIPPFPAFSGHEPSTTPVSYKNGIVFTDKDNNLVYIFDDGKTESQITECTGKINSRLSSDGDFIAYYEKGFPGHLQVLNNGNKIVSPSGETGITIDEIGYGSPSFMKYQKRKYISFITQTGTLYLYDEKLQTVPGFPVYLDNLFYTNTLCYEGNIFSLSENGTLYKTDILGSTKAVKISGITAKNGFIELTDYNKDSIPELFIRGDGNLLYGFNQNLEELPGFPITGFSNPIFMEIAGDTEDECIIMTIDNKILACKL